MSTQYIRKELIKMDEIKIRLSKSETVEIVTYVEENGKIKIEKINKLISPKTVSGEEAKKIKKLAKRAVERFDFDIPVTDEQEEAIQSSKEDIIISIFEEILTDY